MPGSHHGVSVVLVVACLLMVSACAGYSPDDRMLGSSREQVVQIMGQPSTELTNSDGKVMIYPRGPYGKHTYFVYLNRDSDVERWTQVLKEERFERITPDMVRDDVVAIIGKSKDTFILARNRGYVWNYRYVNPHCIWFQIEFTAEDVVRSTGYGKPPECSFRLGF